MNWYNKIIYDILFWFMVLAGILSPISADMKAMFWPSLISIIVIGIMMGEAKKRSNKDEENMHCRHDK
jgi:hypothetical protein